MKAKDMKNHSEDQTINVNNGDIKVSQRVVSEEQYSRLMSQLRIALVPTEAHRELLKTAVHKEVEDLSVIVHAFVPQSEGITKNLVVTANALDAMEIDREQFMKDAIAASERNYPAGMAKLSSFLGVEEGTGAELYVASMPDMANGAGVILYPHFMEKAAQELGGDFYVIPSSVHEVLLLKDDGAIALEDMKEIVRSVNRSEVSHEDFLSDNVYHFDASQRKLEIGEKFQERKLHEKENRHSVLTELSSNKTALKASAEKAVRNKSEMEL